MNTSKKRYDSKHKLTRILLSDYLVLKRISVAAGVSMAEALHRLIEHQAQLPLLDMQIKPAPAAQVTSTPAPVFRVAAMPAVRTTSMPPPAARVAPVTTIATNGSKTAAFRIKPKGARYA